MSIVESIPLSLGETIGSLMTSLVDAQAQAARATVEFIEDIGTVEGASELDTLHELRTVAFKYKKFDENFDNKEFQIEVALLGMVDIPLIAVKNATFHFNYQITQTTKETEQPQSNNLSLTKKKLGDNQLVANSSIRPIQIAKPATIVGKFEKKTTTSTSQAIEKGGLDVTIELEKAAMPIGLERILDMLELASNESQLESDDSNDGNENEGGDASLGNTNSGDTNTGGTNADNE